MCARAVSACLAGLFLALAPGARASGRPAGWIELRTPHFLVVTNGREKQARRVGLQLEQIRSALEQSFPGFRLWPQERMVVLALKDEASMLALVSSPQSRKRLPLPAGVFLDAPERSCLLLRLDEEDDNYHPAYHEYLHALLALNLPRRPLWLEEGLAEFFSAAQFDARGARIPGEGWQTRYLRDRSLLPLEALRDVAPTSALYHDPVRAQLFYAESWALLHFLIFGPGMDQGALLNRYLARLQQGDDEPQAFAETFGPLPQLQARFDQFRRTLAPPALHLKDLPAMDVGSFTLRPLPDEEWAALAASLEIPEHFSHSPAALPRP